MSFNIFINKRKCFIVILLAMIIFGFIKSDFVLAATKPVLYVNGSKSAAKPILVNQLAMLPLRDTFSILGCDNINWDPKTSTVTAITGDLTLTMQVGNKTAYTSLNGNFKVEEELMQTPILQDNKVYLPLRFVAETFKINIAYKGGRIDMITPFMYKDQQWYVNGSMGTSYDKNPQKWELIKIDNLNVLQKGDLIYYRLPFLVSGTVTYLESYLYALDKQGRAKLLFHFPGELHNYKIVEETLYYQTNTSFTSVWPKYEIGKAKLTEPIRGIKLGENDFIYGAKLSFVYSDQSQRYRIDSYKPGNWQVKPEGIYAIGYRSDAFIENDVKDFQHLKDSYGYYLLNNDGNKHTMVEKLDFEYK